ncbi:MAG: hypothetical protein V5A76_04575 [Candidatus Thermoplasmatota archaeon]
MERGEGIFGEDSISIEEVTENISHQDGKTFVGEALEKSLESIGTLPSDNSKALILAEITDLLLDSDILYLAERFGKKAVESTTSIKITTEKAKTLSRIASIFAEYDIDQISDKIFEKALKVAKRVEDEGKRVEVLLTIIEDQLDKGLMEKAEKDLDEALSTALDVAEKKDDVVPLAMVAETMAKIDKERAEDLCERVLPFAQDLEDDRDWILGSVAKAFSRIGLPERSMELVEELMSENISDIKLVEVAITLSQEDQTKIALELRDYVKNQELRDTLTGKIAADLVLDNSAEKALTLRKDIENEFEKDLLLKNIVSHYASSDPKKARDHLQEIGSKEMKALAYRELVLSNLNRDDEQRAKKIALKARDMISDSNSEAIKVELIATLMEVGLQEEAAGLAEGITTSEERAIAFGSIAALSY